MRTITITIDPTGQSRVETTGFRGAACREASRFLEQALGRPTGELLTAEFHEGQRVRQDLEQTS